MPNILASRYMVSSSWLFRNVVLNRKTVGYNVSGSLRTIKSSGSTGSLLLTSPPIRRLHYGKKIATTTSSMLQTRQLSFNSIPKIMGRFIRIPAAAASAAIGGAAYVNYKLDEASTYTSDKIKQVSEWFSDGYSKVKEAVDDIDMPEFSLSQIFRSKKQKNDYDTYTYESQKSKQEKYGQTVTGSATAVAAASVTNVLSDLDDDDEYDSQMMLLTRQMIEIRSILQQVDQTDTLQLPSIVVIGSQSSGKSSVLEAIVGHEFLPKGNNMVTRRPIELTLINTPDSASEYGEFPTLGLGKVTDFTQIQRTLTDLNLAVSESEAVSDDPIQLNIYSPNVPDLTMIDLPGYIQVAALDQPESLKQKIYKLCDKYIKVPNVILAISAADVDLANSTALRASRRVDPRGERTIGVITKMDLVEPARGASMLNNKAYPLQMGYVGVITKTPSRVGGFFRRSPSSITTLVSETENSYFGQHDQFDESCTVGTLKLRGKLMRVLENTMANSLQPTCNAIQQELEEAAYQFKVEYNDRPLTPQTYLAGSVDAFKLAFKEFSSQLGRNEVRKLLKNDLDQQVLDLLAQRYWNSPDDYSPKRHKPSDSRQLLSGLPNSQPDDIHWHRKLDASTSNLSKLGVGRLSTTLVTNVLLSEMERLVDNTNFRNHPFARDTINEAASSILNSRFHSTADQVENCIKPYKYEVDVEDREWTASRDHSYNLLKEELRQCDEAFNVVKKSVGSNKLSQVMKFVELSRDHNKQGRPAENTEAFGFSNVLINKGREALFLRDRSDIIRMRMTAIKSRQCKSKENKYYCPEVFLDVVANKLTQTSVLFLNVELLSDFYYNFPRELDMRLGKNLTDQQISVFAKQDIRIKHHIELQQRKELLELALEKVRGVIDLKKQQARN